jgi:hypothetical protein
MLVNDLDPVVSMICRKNYMANDGYMEIQDQSLQVHFCLELGTHQWKDVLTEMLM